MPPRLLDTKSPNAANAGIKKSLDEQIGAGRGDELTPGSSLYIIQRDPFRSIVRGRQLFQRKFTVRQGMGPRTGDGEGDIEADGSIDAGLSDSCASGHSRPLGSAGFGGNVFTRTESRDAPHLFGLGLQEMLADEITTDLRAIRDEALRKARRHVELRRVDQIRLLAFLDTLLLFAPPDTASNLDPADRNHPEFPIHGHGSIDLSPLFVNPGDKE